MNLNALKLTLAPYMVWIKVGVLAACIGGGVWLGFKLDPEVDCGQLDAETAAELATLRSANAGYEALEAARANEAAKKQQDLRLKLEQEKKDKTIREKNLRARLADVERELSDARKDPKCAELMELEVCETITIPLAPR